MPSCVNTTVKRKKEQMNNKNPSQKPVSISISEDDIKRLDKVVEIKRNPLTPFHDFVSLIIKAIESAEGDEVTLKISDLQKAIPTETDFGAITDLLPSAYKTRLAEGGWNDPGDTDYNLYDTDYGEYADPGGPADTPGDP